MDEKLLDVHTDDLLERLGRELLSGQGAREPERETYVSIGKQWLSKHRELLAEKICSNENVKRLSASPNTERRILLLAAVADLVAGVVVGVSPTTVAALLIREGISSLCD